MSVYVPANSITLSNKARAGGGKNVLTSSCLWIPPVSANPKLRLDGVAHGVTAIAVPSEVRFISDDDINNNRNTLGEVIPRLQSLSLGHTITVIHVTH